MKTAYPKTKDRKNGNGRKPVITDKNNGNPPAARKDDFYQLIAENVRDIIMHAKMKPKFHYDFVSPSCKHITGYTPEEFYADPFLPRTITVPEDRPLVDASRQDISGKSKPVEIRWMHKDGRIIWTEHMMNMTYDIDGKPQNFIVIARDITERKQTEAALQESQKFTDSLLGNAPHATLVINADTSVKYVNPAWECINGWTLEEVVGAKAPYPWWPDEYKESFIEPFKETMKQDGGNSEIFAQKKNGEIYWIAMNWVSIKNNGELAYMIINSVDITDRKKMEVALKESEEKFSKAFSANPNPVCIVTVKEGTFLDVNESFLNFSGYSREEVIGHTPLGLNLWVSKNEEGKMAKGLKEAGRADQLEIRSRMKSGEIKTGLFSAEEIEIGGIKCVTIVITDITESKKAQEALRDSEEKFSKAFQASPSSISISRMSDGRFIEVNDTFLRNKGYTREEVIGHTAEELHISASEQNNSLIRNDIKRRSKIYDEERHYRTKSGDIRIGLVSAEIINIGNEPSMIVMNTDITAQKEVETKLQAHQKLIDSILDNTPQGVLVIDKDNRVVLANKAMQDIFHVNSRTLKNKLLKEIFPTDRYFNLHKAVKFDEAEKNTVEFRYPTEEQEKIIYCVAVKMDGKRTLLTFSDVSKKREEEEKLYLTDRLASLGEMAAGLAHELNNPLTGILALSQMLKNSALPAEGKEDIECIHKEAKRAADIVKNVLLFARNKSGENGQSSPNEVIKDVLRLREYEERINNINVVTNLEENLPYIPLEKGQLQQVFLNMISNAEAAIKEMKNTGTITITTQRVNNHVNIMFSDNGCGIKKQILPRIFDPFFTTKEIGKGTGLGLSICYSIIVKHGGKIIVKSQVNEGTTFTIKMPAVSVN